jgi:Phosphatidylglycerophosphate synthase
MALDSYRGKAGPALERLSKPFMKFNPNSLTAISFILALFAALFLVISGRYIPSYFLILSFVLVILSSLLDAMDGYVARKKNISSKYGDMLDHTFDRYSDIAMITGFTFSIFGNLYIGMLAIGGVFMTSYMGTQAQALGMKRNYGGILGRADRLVIMLLVIIVELVYPFHFTFYIMLTPFTLMLLFFFVAGYATSVERFTKTLHDLKG